MALTLTLREVCDMVKKAGDGPMVCHLHKGIAHVLFHFKDDGCCYVFEIEADEAWMVELMRLAPRIVRSDNMRTFVEAAVTFWPADQCVQRLSAVYEFNRGDVEQEPGS